MRIRSAAFWEYCDTLLGLSGRAHPASEFLKARLAAQEEGVAQATTYEWSNLLTHHRAITGAATQRVNADRLIEVCTWLRGAVLGFPRLCATASEPADLSERLYDAGIPHVFGAITAANQWAFYESSPSVQVYVPQRAVAAARDRLDEPGTRTRVEIYSQMPATLPVAARDLRALAARCRADYGRPYRDKDLARPSGARIPVTTRFVSLLDCRVHPEGASHAAFLRGQILSRAVP